MGTRQCISSVRWQVPRGTSNKSCLKGTEITQAPSDHKGIKPEAKEQKASWEFPQNLEIKQVQIIQVKFCFKKKKPSRELFKYFNHMKVRFYKLDKCVG